MKRFLIAIILTTICITSRGTESKTVYLSFILHGNMNYDRYVRPVIWEEFPVIYDNLLTFMDEHRDFKGQLQFSGQTYGSLLQCAPQVIEHAKAIHERGQLNFTGTFYSEPVNVNMDGETNFRCAWLGTKIIEDAIGETDGFYLQERAYHPQLPWILNHANVSWTPVITGKRDWRPFKLIGMDGSSSICVPITSRSILLKKIKDAPDNSLLLIEEDYEIPQSFVDTYKNIADFAKDNPETRIEWITVKDYLEQFGAAKEQYIDHKAKTKNLINGTYSRWTADPLDIIVQDYTAKAMEDMRSAILLNNFVQAQDGFNGDIPFEGSNVSLIHDPAVWNIERADLYPDIEPKYLARNGVVTLLSKAEHLLLWGVNSDAKGWYPLYEKRRERINAFENSSMLSRQVINNCLEHIAASLKMEGCDKYYLIANMEQSRTSTVSIDGPWPYSVFCNGRQLTSESYYENGQFRTDASIDLPSYGYKLIGVKKAAAGCRPDWEEGNSISSGGISLETDGEVTILSVNGKDYSISHDKFQLKPLAEYYDKRQPDAWRDAEPYGGCRISVRQGLNPQLRIERQLDWLVHMQQIFTIKEGRVFCDINYDFPHPTLVRQQGDETETNFNFDPRGLILRLEAKEESGVLFDIPFGISEAPADTISHICALSSCIMQQEKNGITVVATTGEQAFSADARDGSLSIYLGASTTSGPLKEVGLSFNNDTNVEHERAWYSEPFHGRYNHRLVFAPYNGQWTESHAMHTVREATSPIYLLECMPLGDNPVTEESFLSINKKNIDITYSDIRDGSLLLRVNEKEGLRTTYKIGNRKGSERDTIQQFGIKEILLDL